MKVHWIRILLALALAALIPACDCSENVFITGGTSNFTGGGGLGQGFVPPDVPDVLFLADRNLIGVQELFAANLAGTTIVNLSGQVFGIGEFSWSPDRSRVAFTARKDSSTRTDLYIVSAVGGATLRVSGGVNPVSNFQWAPNSGRLAFDEGTGVAKALYTALAAGGGYVQVAPFASSVFEWAPDSSRIAFTSAGGTSTRLSTTLPTTSAGVVELTSSFTATGTTGDFKWSPSSARVAFIGRSVDTDPFELWTSTPDGSDLDIVSGPLVAAGSVQEFAWAPDGNAIAYRADQEEDQVFELFVSPPTTAVGNVRASADLTGNQSVSNFFRWAPDSSRVAYIANQDTDLVFELYTSTPDGVTNVKVSGTMSPNGNIRFGIVDEGVPFRWAPNSTMIVYLADQDTDETAELYQCSPGAAGTSSKRSGTLVAGGSVYAYVIAPLSNAVAYLADQDVLSEVQVYVANLGSLPLDRVVSGPLVANGDVRSFGRSFVWTANGLTIVYRADQEVDETIELYAAGAGGGGSTKISGLPLLGQFFDRFEVR